MHRSFKLALLVCMFGLFSFGIFGQAKLPASSIKTIYVIPSSHYDFGFIEPPNAIRERAARHIDEIIRVAEENPNFRWTIESVWQINEWLKRQKKPASVLPKDKEKIARLINLIRSGRVAVSTAWGSMHTDYMGAEELNRINYDFARLQNSFGITSDVAYMNDVPGHPMPVASVLASGGTKYLVVGANTFINNATDLAPGKVPFYWQAPDGNRVLLWISQGNRGAYVEALTQYYLDPYTLDPYTDRRPFDMFNPELAGKKSDIEIMEIGVTDLLNNYNKAGYKHDAVMAMYAHDFIEPTSVLNLERAARLWNSRHNEVKIRIATSPEFFEYILSKYGPQIPTFRGEWSGLWSEAKTASPRISAIGRYNHDHAPAAETLWSAIAMTRRLPVPVGNFSEIYDLMFTYDEHSGAGNTGWPQLNSSEPLRQQNREYVSFTNSAKQKTDELLTSGINALADPNRWEVRQPASNGLTKPVLIYNGLSWVRDDVVHLPPHSTDEKIVSIRDASGRNVPFDIDENGNAVFIAKQVPSMGYSTYEVSATAVKPATTLRHYDSTRAENLRFTLSLDRNGTISSIRDKRANREIVNPRGEMAFNDLLRVEGPDASRVPYPVKTITTVSRGGTVMTQLRIHRPQSLFPLTTVTIYNELDRVEIRNELDPSKMPFVGGNNNWHDSYYFAFPFNVSKTGLKVMRGGQRWFDSLPDDYMPGARRDSTSTQHLIGLTDGKSSALIAHRQAYHWTYSGFVSTKVRPQSAPAEFPAMYTGKFPLPEATVYSRAVRWGVQADTHDVGIINLYTTEPGMTGNMVFEYAIAGEGAFEDVRAWRMGSEFNVPLRAVYVTVSPSERTRSFFSIDKPNVDIVTVKTLSESAIRGEVTSAPLNPKVNKVFIVRLQEFAGRATVATVSLPVKIIAATMMNITEQVELKKITDLSPLRVSLKPYECATVRVEIE